MLILYGIGLTRDLLWINCIFLMLCSVEAVELEGMRCTQIATREWMESSVSLLRAIDNKL